MSVLRPLISPNNTINANPGNNTVIITDYADNLRRLGKIIAALDAPATGDIDVVPIKNAIASDIAIMVNRLLEPSVGGPGQDAGRVSSAGRRTDQYATEPRKKKKKKQRPLRPRIAYSDSPAASRASARVG